jgi:formylmethanofuran dehydrogenase subunit E
MNIRSYTFEEYINLVKSFHGHVAPGVVIGGFMVDLALKHLPQDGLFDAICETSACLPDAIELLTPCSIGNRWLRVIDVGRFAITLYEKYGGEGVRVFLDPVKIEAWPEIKSWFFKLKPKKEQDLQLLMEQIMEAGADICSIQQVKVDPRFIKIRRRSKSTICPVCKEAYPVDDGEICRACRGEVPYMASQIMDNGGAPDEEKVTAIEESKMVARRLPRSK